MGNKLKDIFNNHQIQNMLQVSFADKESGKKFAEAMQKLYQTGEPQKIEGIEKITAGCSDGVTHYAKDQMLDPADIMIYPGKSEESFPVETKYGEQILTLTSYAIEDGVVVETKEDFPVYVKFIFDRKTENCKLTFQYKPSRAENVEQVVKAYTLFYAYLKKTFQVGEGDKEYHQWQAICEQFEIEIAFYEKVWEVEKKLGKNFDTSYVKSVPVEEWRECILDVEELYTTLIMKKAVRLPAKLNATESTCVYLEKDQPIEVGKSIELTFTGSTTYQLFGEKITLYTANLLCNAVVKKVVREKKSDTKRKILYGDTDSSPMYIAYTVHMTEEDAQKENKQIMEHADLYREAGKYNEQMV